MTRKKVTLSYITNDTERKASFKKRKKGLIKKVSELSTLCGVEACAIINSQYDAEPVVWPSLHGAEAVLARFQKLSKIDQSRKMVNQESFTRQRVKKAEDQLRRLHKENKRREMENFMFQCLAGMSVLEDFNLGDAAAMSWVINQILHDIKSKMETQKRNDQSHQAATGSAPPTEAVAVAPLLVRDDMMGFPWNLVQTPISAGGGIGFGDRMVGPYRYIFNHGNSTTCASHPRIGGN